MNSITDRHLSIPITSQARKIAKQFADSIQDASTSQQVYHNTLAVLAVNDYLAMLGIATNLKDSESWHPALRVCADVADLKIAGLGHLECRPVLPEAEVCVVPPDVWEDRIGYVAVRIESSQRTATLLGFAQTAGTGKLVINRLQPLAALLYHLDRLRHPHLVNLPQWFANLGAEGWQNLEDIINSFGLSGMQMAYRSPNLQISARNEVNPQDINGLTEILQSHQDEWTKIQAAELLGKIEPGNESAIAALTGILHIGKTDESRRQAAVSLGKIDPSNLAAGARRAKIIDFGQSLGNLQVTLVMTLIPDQKGEINISLRVYVVNNLYLPTNLELAVLDEFGNIALVAEARNTDNWIQLEFSGEPGNDFIVQITLEDVVWQEQFLV